MKPRALLWLLLGACSLVACKRAPGRSCQPREAHCLDPSTALHCSRGTLVEVPCRGRNGCMSRDGKTSCDISANRAGDRCSQDDQGIAVCAAPHEMLVCRGEAFKKVPCGGPSGCEMVGDQPRCDQSVGEIGEACNGAAAKACSADGSRVLACKDGRMADLYRCRGEGRCRADAGKLACDQTVAKLGDSCDKALAGHVACSEDRKALITCRDGRFVPSETCKGRTRCAVNGQSTSCKHP